MSKQQELFTSNWGVNSGFKTLVDELNALLPNAGRCEKPLSDNKNLETFRRAQNAVYDFFNNGLCNKRGLFMSVYGVAPTQRSVYTFTKVSWEMWEDIVEKMLTPIILDAAREQGITND